MISKEELIQQITQMKDKMNRSDSLEEKIIEQFSIEDRNMITREDRVIK